MKTIALIAGDELRYWRRSKVAWTVLITMVLVSLCAAVVSNSEVSRRAEERLAQQAEADAIFQEQPDRHPHRMVHYGHYVYRTASPLAVIDSGIDSMVGTSMFLEGHRQNSATFAAARETGLLARFGSFSPAFALQTLAPLLLIICGFACVTRERENKTLFQLVGQGVSNYSLLLGKTLALWSVALLALLPLLILGFFATGENGFDFRQSLVSMGLGYLLYLSFWVLVIVSVSALLNTSTQSLSVLLGLWIVTVVLVPRIAGAYASATVETPSQIETSLRIAETMRSEGDSHDIEDSAFVDLRTRTLNEYNVDSIEELPFNYRGFVALQGEEADTEVLNKFAEERMSQELAQKSAADSFSIFSPVVALRSLSMSLAGTALQDHHHFLRAAEDYRYNMVQTFNRLQMEGMTLADDLARNSSAASNRRTRLDSANWEEMPVFELPPLSHDQRSSAALQSRLSLAIWLLIGVGLLLFSASRLRT
ncbi:MAG: ABC transporter permease [Pseudohongiellaceae bacterium]